MKLTFKDEDLNRGEIVFTNFKKFDYDCGDILLDGQVVARLMPDGSHQIDTPSRRRWFWSFTIED